MALTQASAERRHVIADDGATVGEADAGATNAVWVGDVTGTDRAGLKGGVFEQAARVSAKSAAANPRFIRSASCLPADARAVDIVPISAVAVIAKCPPMSPGEEGRR
jgi:hypothetical protein